MLDGVLVGGLFSFTVCGLFGFGILSLAVVLGRHQQAQNTQGGHYRSHKDEPDFADVTAQIKEELRGRQEGIAYGLKNTDRSLNRFVYENFVADYLTGYIAANPQLFVQGIDAYLALTVIHPDLIEVAVKRREFDAYQAVKSRLPRDEDGTESRLLVFLAYLGDLQPTPMTKTLSVV